ncbi:MAG: family 1 glycosylhydrolase [Acetobacteraceae bacterium]|nr:family 1 glycosylhydrolase [Acetobacteraceae bacterium]
MTLELWGGIECSVVRVGDVWRDQVNETGHHDRPSDIGRVLDLGVRTLRYPVLWERATRAGGCGWPWHDARMEVLRSAGIRVIAGLLHHGSGPSETHLLDPLFPERLAAYAEEAATRFPFVTGWTPVNEPLTTARFSCLYGHWYPHLRDESAFLRAVANQCRAILLAMRAVRVKTPRAQLVQTEDLAKVFSTPRLAYQAAYENERRWLSLDLLCGHVDATHPWRRRFVAAGVPERHLDELASGEAKPDIVGINYYVTSDRFLDHRTSLYPSNLRGGNGYESYADTEAVRVPLPNAEIGFAARLREAWERYHTAIAITEAHLGCEDPQEQVRWLLEAWQAALLLRTEGVDLRAVTVWALMGSVDWDSLLCECRGRYEAGAFDTRDSPPSPTPLAAAVAGLAKEGKHTCSFLGAPGWWRREHRFHPNLCLPKRVRPKHG